MTTNCTHYQRVFEELLDGSLAPAMAAEVTRHLDGCTFCQQHLAQERVFRQALAQLPAPAMRPGFPAEALAAVRRAQARRHSRTGFVAGFGSAIAAGIALWFAVMLGMPEGMNNGTLQTVSLSLGQTQQVNLVFNSPDEFAQATFALLLPDNAELDGYPGRHEFTWTASLRKGKNRLTLPLRVATMEGGEIIARISHNDEVKEFRLKLEVSGRQGSKTVSPNFT